LIIVRRNTLFKTTLFKRRTLNGRVFTVSVTDLIEKGVGDVFVRKELVLAEKRRGLILISDHVGDLKNLQ